MISTGHMLADVVAIIGKPVHFIFNEWSHALVLLWSFLELNILIWLFCIFDRYS